MSNTRLRAAAFACTALLIVLTAVSASHAGPYALQFDGSDDYVNLGSGASLRFTNEITLEAWVWAPPVANDKLCSIVSSQYDTNCNGASIMLDTRQSPDNQLAVRRHIHFQLGDGSNCWDSWHCSNTNTVVAENQWVHIAATRKANEPAKVYYNGLLQPSTSKNWTGNITYTANWSIGRQQDMTRFFIGKIDEVRIWNRALSEAEVREVMCKPLAGTEAGLAGYWKLDEGTGSTTADATGNGSTGALTNGPVWVSSDLFTSVQPDARIRGGAEASFAGTGVYNDIASQSKTQTIPRDVTAIYYVSIANMRNAPDRFMVAGTPAAAGWTIRYFDESTGSTEISSAIATGWSTPIVQPLDGMLLRIEVTADPGTILGATNETILSVSSSSDPAKTDAVKAVTAIGSATSSALPRTYTTDSDFDLGASLSVEHDTVHDQLGLATTPTTLPFIWIPNSSDCTVSKVNTVTGKEIARYRTSPIANGQPSRTTVDQAGNCWVANRQIGTAVKIGLLESGEFLDRNGNGVADTSQDTNGDGEISGGELLAWGQDECVLYEVVLIPGREGTFAPGAFAGPYANDYWSPGTRGVAVDRNDNVWLGTYNTRTYYQVRNSDGQIIRTVNVSSVGHTAYGAVVDGNGILWSSGNDKNSMLKLDPATGAFSVVPTGHYTYGFGIDRANHLFVSGWQDYKLSRFNVTTGTKDWTIGIGKSKGIAVTPDGDVWTGNYDNGMVSRWSNDGAHKADISVGFSPTGMAVDAAGKIWVMSEYDEVIKRIDPASNSIDFTKRIPGSTHYGYSDMTGIISRNVTARVGTWTIIHDSLTSGAQWGTAIWNASVPSGTSISVRARSSNDMRAWSGWQPVENGVAIASAPAGRFLQVEVTLKMTSSSASPVLYDLTVLPRAQWNTIHEAKVGADGESVNTGLCAVTAAFDGVFYIEELNRCSGVRVARPGHGLSVGDRVTVFGALGTNPNGERYVDASLVVTGGTGGVAQLGITNRNLGGAGLDNTGLLVTTWGKVVGFDSASPKTWFTIDDGSGHSAKCVVPRGVNIDTSWSFLSVTGAASCEKVGDSVYPVILVRTADDIVL